MHSSIISISVMHSEVRAIFYRITVTDAEVPAKTSCLTIVILNKNTTILHFEIL